MSLVQRLPETPADLSALREVFAKFADPSDQVPEYRGDVRSLAESLHRRGQPHQATLILVAALEDLRRYFDEPDEDDDAGWHRSQHKYWESWAYCRSLRRILVTSDPEAPWRPEALDAIKSLWTDLDERRDVELEDWISAETFAPLPPRDAAFLSGRTPEPPTEAWTAPEARVAERLVMENHLDFAALDEALDNEVDPYDQGDAISLLDRVDLLRTTAEHLEHNGDAALRERIIVLLAVAALLLRTTAEADEELAISEARDAVFDEQVDALEALLVGAVERGGAELREEAKRLVQGQNFAIEQRVCRLLGTDDAAVDPQEDVARLRARSESAQTEDERRTIDFKLIYLLGEHLPDEEFLSLCQRWNCTEPAVRRLLQRGRADEAFTLATACFTDSEWTSPIDLCSLGRAFLDGHQPGLAEQLLRPHLNLHHDVTALFAETLRVQGKPEAADAYFAWFKQRPMLATYTAIEQAFANEAWPALRERIVDHLRKASLTTSLLDIAVHEEDLAALETLVPRLTGTALDHARNRIGLLRQRLTPETARLLEPRQKPLPPSDRGTSSPKPRAKGPPQHVTHPKFGRGRVVRVEGTGDGCKYVVSFEEHGEKTLLARFLTPAS